MKTWILYEINNYGDEHTRAIFTTDDCSMPITITAELKKRLAAHDFELREWEPNVVISTAELEHNILQIVRDNMGEGPGDEWPYADEQESEK